MIQNRKGEMMFRYAVVMAAGEGKRLYPLTAGFPKALIDVNGKHLISYSLNQILPLTKNVYVTVGHEKTKVMKYLERRKIYNPVDTEGKGNAWWIFHSIFRDIDEPVLVLPCDVITRIDISFICRNYMKTGKPACLLIPVIPVDGIEGDYISEKDGLVRSLSRERKSASYCSGIQIVNPNRICRLVEPSDSFTELWAVLAEKKLLYCSDIYPHFWYSINTEAQLRKYCEYEHNTNMS
jgi:NDP-sugar pyrophosphorylase family protein